MQHKPRNNWSITMKEFLAKSFDENVEAIIDNKDEFIEMVHQKFPGSKLSRNLLNAYLSMWRKGKLKIKDRKPYSAHPKVAFHQEAFLKFLADDNTK